MKQMLLAVAVAGTGLGAPAAELPALVLARTLPLPEVRGGFNHHSADGMRHRIFLCARDNDSVEVIDADSGRVVKSLSGGRPSAVCYCPGSDRLCVSRGRSVEIYAGDTLARLAVVVMPAGIDEMHYDTRTARLIVGCMTAPNQGIGAIDPAKPQVGPIIRVGAGLQGFAVEDDGPRVFVCTPALDRIAVVDREKGTVVDWKLPEGQSDHPVAFDVASHRLFVGCRRPPQLLVLDTDTGRRVGSADIGADTDDLSWDAANRRIYVACGEGVISVVQQDDPDHYRNVQTIKTALGARNCGFIPETREFFVTVPQATGRPATLLIFRAQPR